MTPARYVRETLLDTIVVEAVQLVAGGDNTWDDIAAWCGGRLFDQEPYPGGDPETVLYLGNERGREGDWVVRFPTGFLLFGPDVFEVGFRPA